MARKIFNSLLIILIIMGIYAAARIFVFGLGLTNLNNVFVFGLWIIFDLFLIAIASGAACASALCYLGGKKDLRKFLPFSVALSLLCYATAGGILLLELGQPLRFWFPLRYPNLSSMLAEVTFCLTLYGVVLSVELVLAVLSSGSLGSKMSNSKIVFRILAFAAILGILLSTLHQGSLGGVFGALKARLFAARPVFLIWPWTFIPFATSAFAAGSMFSLVAAKVAEKFSKKEVLNSAAFNLLVKVGIFFLSLSFLSRLADILLWRNFLLNGYLSAYGSMFYERVYGEGLLYMEVFLGMLLPLVILLVPTLRRKSVFVYIASALILIGLAIGRYTIALQTLARPEYSFGSWEVYSPNRYEVLPCLAGVAFILLAMQLLYRKKWL